MIGDDAVFTAADFADLYLRFGQLAHAAWRLALGTAMQFREGLSDPGAAEAVQSRIDWKHLPSLDLDDTGFDHCVLWEFRRRLLDGGATDRLFARVREAA